LKGNKKKEKEKKKKRREERISRKAKFQLSPTDITKAKGNYYCCDFWVWI
jgi:hypothetical protein